MDREQEILNQVMACMKKLNEAEKENKRLKEENEALRKRAKELGIEL